MVQHVNYQLAARFQLNLTMFVCMLRPTTCTWSARKRLWNTGCECKCKTAFEGCKTICQRV